MNINRRYADAAYIGALLLVILPVIEIGLNAAL